MRRLLLLRHAKTQTEAPSRRDFDRRLDDRGRTDAGAIGAWLNKHQPQPDRVCVSTALRAAETWELVAAEWLAVRAQPSVAHLEQLYGAGPAELLAVIHAAAANDPQTLVIVGHNPGLHEMALALTGGGDEAGQKMLAENMPTSGIAVIDFAVDDWGEVAFRGGELVCFVSPKLLKGEAGA